MLACNMFTLFTHVHVPFVDVPLGFLKLFVYSCTLFASVNIFLYLGIFHCLFFAKDFPLPLESCMFHPTLMCGFATTNFCYLYVCWCMAAAFAFMGND